MRRILLLSIVFTFLWTTLSIADGMPIDENGRFYGGPTTIIELTNQQIETLENPERKWGRIPLSAEQRSMLKQATGKDASLFHFYDTRKHENDCTCAAANRALRYSEREAEIPHEYLTSDEEAAVLDRDH